MTENLPLIDVHAVDVEAAPDHTWHAVTTELGTHASGLTWAAIATALGCSERHIRGQPDSVGSTIPGFRIVRADPPCVLSLEGSHRFSDYALDLRVEQREPTRSRVSAESRALFPGAFGTIYRTLVIDSRGHTIAVRGLLRLIKRAAETTPTERSAEH